jgi:hypothetical protein
VEGVWLWMGGILLVDQLEGERVVGGKYYLFG